MGKVWIGTLLLVVAAIACASPVSGQRKPGVGWSNVLDSKPRASQSAWPQPYDTVFAVMDRQLTEWVQPRPVKSGHVFTDGTNSAWGNPTDHRWEGSLIGAGVVGLTFAYGLHKVCADDDSNGSCVSSMLGGVALGGLIGGVLGGLIGSAVPKTPD